MRMLRRSTVILARRGAEPRTLRCIERASPGSPRRDLVGRHVDVRNAAAVELVEPGLQAHELGHEVAAPRRSGPRCRRRAAAAGRSPSASRRPTARRARSSGVRACDQAGGGDEALRRRTGRPRGRARRRSMISRYSIGWPSSTSSTRPSLSMTRNCPSAPWNVGHRRALADLDRRPVREVGRARWRRSTHGIASSSRSARVGVGAQHRRAVELVDDGLQRAPRRCTRRRRRRTSSMANSDEPSTARPATTSDDHDEPRGRPSAGACARRPGATAMRRSRSRGSTASLEASADRLAGRPPVVDEHGRRRCRSATAARPDAPRTRQQRVAGARYTASGGSSDVDRRSRSRLPAVGRRRRPDAGDRARRLDSASARRLAVSAPRRDLVGTRVVAGPAGDVARGRSARAIDDGRSRRRPRPWPRTSASGRIELGVGSRSIDLGVGGASVDARALVERCRRETTSAAFARCDARGRRRLVDRSARARRSLACGSLVGHPRTARRPSNPTRRTSLRSTEAGRRGDPVADGLDHRPHVGRRSALGAWMKLACFSDTHAVPMRRPRRPSPSMRPPALTSPGTGLTNTEPQFWPPGWCSRRQRTISAIVASAGSRGRRRRSRSRRRDARPGGRRGPSRGSAARAGRRPRRTATGTARRGRARRRRRGTRPCPSRGRRRSSAPRRRPMPGTPTAHSNPVSPAAARAAGEHRQRRRRRRPSTTSARPSIVDLAGARSASADRDAGEPGVGDEQVRAPADDEHRQARRPAGRGDARRRSSIERGRTNSAAAPADAVRGHRARAARRVVASGPSTRGGDVDGGRHVGRRVTAILRCAAAGEHLLGQGGDVAAAHRDAHVARADLAGQERHHVVAPRQPHDAGPRVGVEHGVDDQLAGDPRDRRRARRVDVGDHDDVGVDERVGVLAPTSRRCG